MAYSPHTPTPPTRTPTSPLFPRIPGPAFFSGLLAALTGEPNNFVSRIVLGIDAKKKKFA